MSGVTSQTTCNNVIEALIEDELQSMNAHNRGELLLIALLYSPIIIISLRNNNRVANLLIHYAIFSPLILFARNSTHLDAALSHDLRDYVITERWRDVEQPLPGNTFILALWKAWGTKCATNEVNFSPSNYRVVVKSILEKKYCSWKGCASVTPFWRTIWKEK